MDGNLVKILAPEDIKGLYWFLCEPEEGEIEKNYKLFKESNEKWFDEWWENNSGPARLVTITEITF